MNSVFLATVSGIVLFLIFPKFNFALLAWLAMVPMLVSLTKSKTRSHSLALGLLTGLIFFAGTIYWIPSVVSTYGGLSWIPAAGVYLLLVVALSLFVGIFGFVFHLLRERYGDQAFLLVPFLWVSLEYARNFLVVNGFPWCLLGYSQTRYLSLIQISDMTGVYGVSFLIAAVNAFLTLLIKSMPERKFLAPSFCILLLILSSIAYGQWRLGKDFSQPRDKKLKVACIQGNVPVVEDIDQLTAKLLIEYPKLIAEAAAGGNQLVILPESQTPFSVQDPAYRAFLEDVVRKNQIGLVVNGTTYSTSPQTHFFNSAYLMAPDGKLISRYDKMHLVPFGEYVPMRNVLFFAGKILNEVGDFKPGALFTISEFEGTKFATLICFESIFPELVRKFVQRGAQFLVIVTNDSWYGYSAAPYQHFDAAIFRAIENRRYVVRAANGGISGIIDPWGRILKRTELFEPAIVAESIQALSNLSLYARFGDVFAWFCVIIILGALAIKLSGRQLS